MVVEGCKLQACIVEVQIYGRQGHKVATLVRGKARDELLELHQWLRHWLVQSCMGQLGGALVTVMGPSYCLKSA